jgi:hypothetical protein
VVSGYADLKRNDFFLRWKHIPPHGPANCVIEIEKDPQKPERVLYKIPYPASLLCILNCTGLDLWGAWLLFTSSNWRTLIQFFSYQSGLSEVAETAPRSAIQHRWILPQCQFLASDLFFRVFSCHACLTIRIQSIRHDQQTQQSSPVVSTLFTRGVASFSPAKPRPSLNIFVQYGEIHLITIDKPSFK